MSVDLEDAFSIRGGIDRPRRPRRPRRSALKRMLEEREVYIGHLELKLAGAEAQVAEVRERLSEAETKVQEEKSRAAAEAVEHEQELAAVLGRLEEDEERDQELVTLRARVSELESIPPPPPLEQVISDLVNGELESVLQSAREAAARLIENAEEERDRTTGKATELWGEVQARLTRFGSWRAQAEPRLGAVSDRVESLRSLLQEVPRQIEAALAPMTDAFAAADEEMRALKAVFDPPVLEVPSGFVDAPPASVVRDDAGEPDSEEHDRAVS